MVDSGGAGDFSTPTAVRLDRREARGQTLLALDLKLFQAEIDAAELRVAEICRRVEKLDGDSGTPFGELLEALRTSLEELRVAEEELRSRNEQLELAKHATDAAIRSYRELFEAAPGGYVITDSSGVITKANRAASLLLGREAYALRGKPLVRLVAEGDRRRFLTWLSALRKGTKNTISGLDVRLCRRRGKDWLASLQVTADEGTSDDASGFRWWIQDLGERARTDEELRSISQSMEARVQERTAELGVANEKARAALLRLSDMLGRAQEEEQRRLARELHDGLGQNVAALIVNLTLLRQHATSLDAPGRRALRECLALGKLCSREVRTAAYLLHPPLLEVGGLRLALRHFVREFRRRSAIRVELDLPRRSLQLPSGMDLTLFRTVRECLLNVHRHSGSRRASVSLQVTPAEVRLEVRDRGRGFPARLRRGNAKTFSHLGVGLMGMRERIRQLGGDLSIQSDGRGATVSAVIPLKGGCAR